MTVDFRAMNRRDLSADPRLAYRDSMDPVGKAFAPDDVDDGPVQIRDFGVFPKPTPPC